MSLLNSVAHGLSVGLQMHHSMDHHPRYNGNDETMTENDLSSSQGEDYVTPTIFSGWAVIISKAPYHSVIQDTLIYCQNEQINKTVYVMKGLNSFFFTGLLAGLLIARQMGCRNMFFVLQSSVPPCLCSAPLCIVLFLHITIFLTCSWLDNILIMQESKQNSFLSTF